MVIKKEDMAKHMEYCDGDTEFMIVVDGTRYPIRTILRTPGDNKLLLVCERPTKHVGRLPDR